MPISDHPASFLSPNPAAVPLILGHRGASQGPGSGPENTLLALTRALHQGADGVELDVMRCGSGEVVVVHDETLSRVARGQSGADCRVRQTPLAKLRRFDLGEGQRLPTLDEVLQSLGERPLINIELKTQEVSNLPSARRYLQDDGLAQAVADVLARHGRLNRNGRTLLSSFDPFLLFRANQACKGQVPLGHLFHARQSAVLRNLYRMPGLLFALDAVHPEAKLLDAQAVRAYRRKGLRIHTWTVDCPWEIAAVATLGVDCIITNRPKEALDSLRAFLGPVL